MLKNNTKKLITIRDFVCFMVRRFDKAKLHFGHGTDNAYDEAVFLILYALNLPQIINKTILNKKLTLKEQQSIVKTIDLRIKKRIPAAYLTKQMWFCDLPFYVDKRVLIPRSPLAELIQHRFVPWINPKKVKRILDVGTGSGCIAISCAYAFPKAKIDAIDISSNALKVAAINCKKHKVTKKLRLLKSNVFSALKNEIYDVIISNPPYVGKVEMQTLPKEYQHEPSAALFAGKQGGEIVEKILKNAAKHLSPHGILIVEVGNSISLILKKYPQLPFVWLEFEAGESEVFLLTADQLKKHLYD